MTQQTSRWFDDVLLCIAFYTIVPLRLTDRQTGHAPADFARAQWAAPLAGIMIGLTGGGVFMAAQLAGLPALVTAVLGVAAGVLLTGALHEDGLADVADGFGGGQDRPKKLAIMRDSRIGTYGVLALIISFALRTGALAALAGQTSIWPGVLALVAAHGSSRAMLPLFVLQVPPARRTGLGAGMSALAPEGAVVALTIGFMALVPCDLLVVAFAVALLSAWFGFMRWLSLRQIGGQTGDVLGALQQGGEITVLLTASVFLVS